MAAREKDLTIAEVLAVFHAKGSHQKVGVELGVSPAHVGAIKRGRYHRDITGARLRQTRREVVSPQKQRAIEEHPGTAHQAAQELGVSVRTVNRYRLLRRLRTQGGC